MSEITFTPNTLGPHMSTCSECGAVVDNDRKQEHIDFHNRTRNDGTTGTILEPDEGTQI